MSAYAYAYQMSECEPALNDALSSDKLSTMFG